MTNEKGFALIMTLVILVSLTMLGVTLISLSNLEERMGTNVFVREKFFECADGYKASEAADVLLNRCNPNPPPVPCTTDEGVPINFVPGAHYDYATTDQCGGLTKAVVSGMYGTNRSGVLGLHAGRTILVPKPGGGSGGAVEVEIGLRKLY